MADRADGVQQGVRDVDHDPSICARSIPPQNGTYCANHDLRLRIGSFACSRRRTALLHALTGPRVTKSSRSRAQLLDRNDELAAIVADTVWRESRLLRIPARSCAKNSSGTASRASAWFQGARCDGNVRHRVGGRTGTARA